MKYKYLAWKDGKYWRGHNLLHRNDIKATLGHLAWEYQVFASIQNYNEDGSVHSCPIYFDLDGEPETVIDQTKELVALIEYTMNVTPAIHFSGTKGFHVTIPHLIQHEKCHLIVKDIAEQTRLNCIDLNVYTPRRYWRIHNSPASTPGAHKIQISKNELFDLKFHEIAEIAIAPRDYIYVPDLSKLDLDFLNQCIEAALENLPKPRTATAIQSDNALADMTPCLKTIFNKMPDEGMVNKSIFLLARFFKSCGLSREETNSIFFTKDHWNYVEESRQVTKVTNSVFFTDSIVKLGCKTSDDTGLMRKNCDTFCQYHEEFNVNFIDTKKEYSC